jgi:hypothetical protein
VEGRNAHCVHFKYKHVCLLECPLYWQERNSFLQNIFNNCPNVCHLQPDMQFLWIMNAEDRFVCTETAKYVHVCLQKRQNNATIP